MLVDKSGANKDSTESNQANSANKLSVGSSLSVLTHFTVSLAKQRLKCLATRRHSILMEWLPHARLPCAWSVWLQENTTQATLGRGGEQIINWWSSLREGFRERVIGEILKFLLFSLLSFCQKTKSRYHYVSLIQQLKLEWEEAILFCAYSRKPSQQGAIKSAVCVSGTIVSPRLSRHIFVFGSVIFLLSSDGVTLTKTSMLKS